MAYKLELTCSLRLIPINEYMVDTSFDFLYLFPLLCYQLLDADWLFNDGIQLFYLLRSLVSWNHLFYSWKRHLALFIHAGQSKVTFVKYS